MHKILLILKREYSTRIKNKTFLLSTFLVPFMFAAFIGLVVSITIRSTTSEKVAVADQEGIVSTYLQSDKNLQFEPVKNADTTLLNKGFTAVLMAPGNGINQTNRFQIYTQKSLSLATETRIQNKLDDAYEGRMMEQLTKLSKASFDSIKASAKQVSLDNMVLSENASIKRANSGLAYGLGYGGGFLIYITLFIYGAMVMRGVMEEKTNRIAEVVVSSVSPFQLMMGKILGIGAVGLTQILLWVILFYLLSAGASLLIPAEVLAQANDVQNSMPGSNATVNESMLQLAKAKIEFQNVNWFLIVFCFLFYFLFGYLFYAALFAAVGSAVGDDAQDAQTLMFPITIPIIIAMVIMINAINQPDSAMATWASIIPFTSPIVMMARIPFGVPGTVPWWQLISSMALLVLGFLLVTWASAKIYRTGILMYGKKASFKEMFKWATRP